MATIVVFASSLSLASVLVLIKASELKHEKKNILLKLINKLDSKLNEFVPFLRFKSFQLIQSIRYLILVKMKKIAEDLFHKVKEKILNEYKIRQGVIMGHKEIIDNGSASFYLRKITEGKSNGRKGKIEESL